MSYRNFDFVDCSTYLSLAGTAESNALYASFQAGSTAPLSAPMAGVRKSFSEGNIKLFARATSIEMTRGDLPTLAEEGTNGDARQVLKKILVLWSRLQLIFDLF
jgi:hypothetical protein